MGSVQKYDLIHMFLAETFKRSRVMSNRFAKPRAGRWRRKETGDLESCTERKRVCVVGAGVAALTAAKRLQGHGFDVQVFGYCGKNEQGHGAKLGGRLFTEVWDLKANKMKGP